MVGGDGPKALLILPLVQRGDSSVAENMPYSGAAGSCSFVGTMSVVCTMLICIKGPGIKVSERLCYWMAPDAG